MNDRFGLTITLVMCVVSLLAAAHDWRIGVLNFTISGLASLVFLSSIRERGRQKRCRGSTVQLRGGIDIPVDRRRHGVLCGALLLLGTAILACGGRIPPTTFFGLQLPFQLMAVPLLFAGGFLAVAIPLGWPGRRFLRFEPRGMFIVERRYTLCIPWEHIREARILDMHGNPFVLLASEDLREIEVTPPRQAPVFHRTAGNHRRLMGADIVIMPRLFGLDAELLLAAITRYSADPAARWELATPAGRTLPRPQC